MHVPTKMGAADDRWTWPIKLACSIYNDTLEIW